RVENALVRGAVGIAVAARDRGDLGRDRVHERGGGGGGRSVMVDLVDVDVAHERGDDPFDVGRAAAASGEVAADRLLVIAVSELQGDRARVFVLRRP